MTAGSGAAAAGRRKPDCRARLWFRTHRHDSAKKQKQTRSNQKGEKALAVPADLPRGEDESAAQLVVPVDLGVVQCLVETGDQELEWACTTGNKTQPKQSFNLFR